MDMQAREDILVVVEKISKIVQSSFVVLSLSLSSSVLLYGVFVCLFACLDVYSMASFLHLRFFFITVLILVLGLGIGGIQYTGVAWERIYG